MFVKKLEDLQIYPIALDLAKEVNALIGNIHCHWKIEECGQLLRSSSSSPSNIQEGFSQRFYPKKFILFLNIAIGSSDESQGHFEKLKNNNQLEAEVANAYIKRYKNLSIKTLNFINYLRKRHDIR